MKKQLLMLAMMLLLAGCIADTRTWMKPDATEADFERDKAICISTATAATQNIDHRYASEYAQTLDQLMRRGNLAKLCMEGKGYHKIDTSTIAPEVWNLCY